MDRAEAVPYGCASSGDSSLQVPVVDMAKLVDEIELQKLHHACKNWGIFKSIWISVKGQRELDEAKLRFAAAEGDHVTFLNVYKGFLQSNKSSKWCHKNLINYHAMKKVMEVREQLRRIAQRLGLALKSCENDMQVLRKAVTAGFFANACRLEPYSHNEMYKTIRSSQEVNIHPSSVLFRVNPKWVIYNSLVSTDRQYMHNVISIEPSWLREAAPHFYQHQPLNANRH